MIDNLRKDLEEKGFCKIPNFFSYKEDIQPIKFAINKITSLLVEKYLGKKTIDNSDEDFVESYLELIAHNRSIGGIVYDAVKQIPEFASLVSSKKCAELFKELRNTKLAGLCRGGDGIRIDNPKEEKFKSPWHQEYPVQYGSINGLVYWSPLLEIDMDIGPLHILSGSHKEGLLKVCYPDEKNRTPYGLRIVNEDELENKYECMKVLCSPGDLLIMDFLTVHKSGNNVSNRSRWSMQYRYFDFLNDEARKIDWANNVSQGNSIEKLYPHYLVEKGR